MSIADSVREQSGFSYEPLPQEDGRPRERLLHLPEDDGAAVHTISVHELDGAPQFCALSYVWGVETASEWIRADGKALAVRPNLAGVLNQLRWKVQPRYMWIDAVCVNQTNLQERNSQVQMMASIYRQAQRVYVWFGFADLSSDFVMEPDLASRLPKNIHEAPAGDVAGVKESFFDFTQ
jgi:hypothetical protein